MDKTININLGGTLFSIDEEAYRILRDYLQAIDNKFRNVAGGAETIEDIEARIAEIFISKKGTAGVISRDNVEEMISIIGRPEDFGQPEANNPSWDYSPSRKKMFRNPDDTIIGGVCGGIGTYLNTDPVWIRILFVVFALMFGFGFFVYLALWIALPSAVSETQKKEMYGATEYRQRNRSAELYSRPNQTSSKVGNAFNEIFRAFGRICFIIVRIFLILIGTCLVLTGFMALVSFVMIFVFKFPGAFSAEFEGLNLSYVPDFLHYVVTPAYAPWITALITIVVTLPLLALIYGGIRLIFWFRVRDGWVWLTGIILWAISTAVLSIMLFNEGVSFAESARSITQVSYTLQSDTLFIRTGKSIEKLDYDNDIIIPDGEYSVFIAEEKKEIYIASFLDIDPATDDKVNLDIRKRSSGRNKNDAMEKSERLLYNYSFSSDTLYLDEYFTIPADTKWSFDAVGVNISVPVGTIVYLDKQIDRHINSNDYYDEFPSSSKRFWLMTENGLELIESGKGNK